MEAPGSSALLLRLCECRVGDVVEGVGHAQPVPRPRVLGAGGGGAGGGRGVPLGTAVAAQWDPTHANRVGVLYSSGTLRLWDVVSDARRDFALYIPASGLPAPTSVDAIERPVIADRRLAVPMTHFEFLPSAAPTALPVPASSTSGRRVALPRIAFALRGSGSLYLADLPLGAPPQPAGDAAVHDDHYLRGSRVYECSAALPAAPTAMTAWLVAAAPAHMVALAVGCADGGLVVWLLSTAFNPETVVSMRSLRDASPGMIRALQLTPTGAGSALTSAGAAAGAPPTEPTCARLAAHTGRVRALRALALLDAHDAGAPGGLPDDDASRVRVGAHAAARAAATAGPANTLLVSSGDDGRVLLWRLEVSAPVAPFAPPPSTLLLHPAAGWERGAAAPRAAPFAVSLTRALQLPTDGTTVTALASTPWPLASEDSVGRFLSAAAAFTTPAAQAAAAPWRVGAAYHARALLATGAADGSVTVWEVLVPRDAASIMVAPGGAPWIPGPPPGSDRYGARAAVAPPALPAVRLIGLVAAVGVDAVAAVAVAPPAPPAGEEAGTLDAARAAYTLAVGGVDGVLSLYALDGITRGGSGGGGPGGDDAASGGGDLADVGASPGSAGPVIIRLQGRVGDATAADPYSLHVVAAMSHEAAMLAHLPVSASGAAAAAAGCGVAARGGGRPTFLDDASSLASDPLAPPPPAVGTAVTSRYTTALTAAALAGLQRALVATAFNPCPLAPACPVGGALLACSGAGEVSLWPADALPGSPGARDGGSLLESSSASSVGAGAHGEAAPGGAPLAPLPPARLPSLDELLHQPARPLQGAAGELSAAGGAAASSNGDHLPAAAGGLHATRTAPQLRPPTLPAARDDSPPPQPLPPAVLRGPSVPGAGSPGSGAGPQLTALPPPLPAFPHAGATASIYDDDGSSNSSNASWAGGPPSAGGAGGAGGAPATPSRVLAHTAASRMRRSQVSGDAGGGGDGGSGSSSNGVGGARGRRRSASAAAERDYLRHAAADAVRSVYEPAVEGRRGAPLHHAQHLPTALAGGVVVPPPERWLRRLHAAAAAREGGGGGGATSSRSHSRSRSRSASGHPGGASPAHRQRHPSHSHSRSHSRSRSRSPPHTSPSPPPPPPVGAAGAALDATSASAGKAAAAMLRSGSGSGGGDGRGGAGSRLQAGCRNPARVAAALLRDAKEVVRASTILARSVDGHLTAVDVHPDAVGVYDRIAARGPDQHHHMVAPTVGSSAAIVARIAALEAATFDVAAAARRALAVRGCTDRVVANAVHGRLGIARSGGTGDGGGGGCQAACTPSAAAGAPPPSVPQRAEPTLEEELAYVPARAAGPPPPRAPPTAPAIPSTSRVLRATKASAQRAARGDGSGDVPTVSAADMLSYHSALRHTTGGAAPPRPGRLAAAATGYPPAGSSPPTVRGGGGGGGGGARYTKAAVPSPRVVVVERAGRHGGGGGGGGSDGGGWLVKPAHVGHRAAEVEGGSDGSGDGDGSGSEGGGSSAVGAQWYGGDAVVGAGGDLWGDATELLLPVGALLSNPPYLP